QIGFGAELTEAFGGGYLLDRLDGISEELGFATYTEGQRTTRDVFFITAALMFGTAGLPHVIIRFFTVPSVRDARRSAGFALIFIAILYTTAPAVAAFARTNLITTVSNIEYTAVPEWFSKWETTNLISFEDKNNDGRIQYVGDPERNELEVNRDIMVLANPEIAGLPNWVVALVAAGALAAALSTAAGLLLVISTAVAHDLLKRSFMPAIAEKQELLYARIAIFIAVLVAGYVGVNPPAYVAQVVAYAFGLAAASFFPAIVLGIFQKRMNKHGAISGMLTGFILTAAYIIYFKTINPSADNPENWLLGISPEGIGTLGTIANFTVAMTVSKFTPTPPRKVQAIVEDIRLPGGAVTAN
ncbi:MAG: VC_2705 family sodium/solute symporter, partial [Pseudomonadota bacterium]|nr:VC_2705 family sodium/solute symporter [Pseudomonadota bacterium]